MTKHDPSDYVAAVQHYIRTHLDEPLNRKTLAGVAGCSIPHLHRLFAAVMGESIAHYVCRLRLERAGRKLRMGAVNITDVALAAGYANHAAFSKAFKKTYGLTPSAFRQLGCRAASDLLRKGQVREDQTRQRAD